MGKAFSHLTLAHNATKSFLSKNKARVSLSHLLDDFCDTLFSLLFNKYQDAHFLTALYSYYFVPLLIIRIIKSTVPSIP